MNRTFGKLTFFSLWERILTFLLLFLFRNVSGTGNCDGNLFFIVFVLFLQGLTFFFFIYLQNVRSYWSRGFAIVSTLRNRRNVSSTFQPLLIGVSTFREIPIRFRRQPYPQYILSMSLAPKIFVFPEHTCIKTVTSLLPLLFHRYIPRYSQMMLLTSSPLPSPGQSPGLALKLLYF